MTQEIKVAFPLGIGDCHWSAQKIAGLQALHPGCDIVAHVNESPDHKSWGYLDLIPEIARAEKNGDAPMSIEHELEGTYRHERWTRLDGCRNWQGYDYVLVANAWMEAGRPIDQWIPELATQYSFDYRYPEGCEERCLALMPDPAVLLYLSGVGPNEAFHGGTWKPEDWVTVVSRLNRAGRIPILVGAPSVQDLAYRDRVLCAFTASGLHLMYNDLIGQTTIPEYVHLIERARVWVGLNSGGGMVAASAGTPTVMFWADKRYPVGTQHFEPKMQTAWLSAEQLETYRPVPYGSPYAEPERVAELILEIAR